jgi:tetratricopeptide (TPR) repeat protein
MKKSTIILLLIGTILASFIFMGFQCGSPEVTSARLYEQRSDWANMEKALMKELEKNSINAEAWFLLGRSRLMQKKVKEMVDAFDHSLQVSNDFQKDIVDIKKFVWGSSLNAGVNSYNASVKATPDSVQILRDKAIAAYNDAITVMPDSTLAYQNISIVYRVMGNIDEEIRYLKLALDKKKDPQISIDLINTYLRKIENLKKEGKDVTEYTNRAIQAIGEARATNPDNQELLGVLINTYIDAGKAEEALPLMQESVQKNPGNKIFQNNLGILLKKMGKFEEAVEHFDAAVAADSKFEDALRNGSVAYLELGDKMKKAAMENADPKSKKKIDKSYIEKFKKSIEYLEKLNEIKPNEIQVWDALAIAYGNAEMLDKAKAAIKKADELRKK